MAAPWITATIVNGAFAYFLRGAPSGFFLCAALVCAGVAWAAKTLGDNPPMG